MPSPAKITIVDVARAAGVAVGTVSRVFNNAADVNAAIRLRVLEKARELNYTRLRQRRARAAASDNGVTLPPGAAIGAVFFGMEDTLVQLPVVSAGLQGIESTLSAHGRSLMIANIPVGDRVPPFLRDGSVAGVLLKGPNQGLLPSPSENDLVRAILAVPHVWLMGRPANATGDHCNFDTSTAGRLAVEHLHAKGHRRVAFFNPKPGQIQFERVKASFIANASRLDMTWSLLEAEPAPTLAWPLPAITNQDKVDSLVDRWAATPRASRPTAFFVPSDRTAVQLYSSLAHRGLTVGKDVSMVSCNNERSLLSNLHPGLTSIDIHADFIGRRAVDQLLWRIAHPMEPNTVQLLAEPTLVERASVATL
ncbi:MAG: LacI family DNA-binding transcriptional regulator [Opitutaceae bacterium]|nr:LacI family DNA-binding transcriptional regulator [Opitutaceae bacterium]